MVSLFLVEDERIARESIRKNVPWQEHDIQFLGDAPDGEMALPQILEKRPDILLTDIKMPFMDGLELSRIVRRELPDTSIIILSGYNDFEYARKAITLGVNDYLLKPVSSQDILKAVDRARTQILERRSRQMERHSYDIAQRELLFSNLYSGIPAGTAQILRRGSQLGFSLTAGAYQLVLAELSGEVSDRAGLREKLYAAPMAYGSGFDGERVTFLLLAENSAGLQEKYQGFSAWLAELAKKERVTIRSVLGKMIRSVPFDTFLVILGLGLLNLHLPQPVYTVAGMFGQANAFLAMLMIGLLLEPKIPTESRSDVLRVVALRYGFGLAGAAVCWLLPLPAEVRQVLVLSLLAPVPSVALAYCDRAGCDPGAVGAIHSLCIPISLVFTLLALFLL